MSRGGPVRLESASGLAIQVNANGSLGRIEHGGVTVNAFPGNELEGGPANLFLRRLGARAAWIPLLGPHSPGRIRLDRTGLEISGEWPPIRFAVRLRLAESSPAWFWHLAVENAGSGPETLDVVYAQDLALADYAGVRLNEYYVSHYVDHTPLLHPERGVVLAARQNLAVDGRHPWLLVGSLGRGASFATDALQLLGLAPRAGGEPEGLVAARLPGERRQHEHSLAAIQEEPVRLGGGARLAWGFFNWLEPDHRGGTSADDLARVDRALALPEAAPPPALDLGAGGTPPAATLFSARPPLASAELDEAELAACFGGERRAAEREAGRLLSFFTGAHAHVVLPAKERTSLRPHGQILRTGDRLAPDEASLTSTVWMGGVFHSMLTQGHVGINRLLSTARGYLGLFRSHGLRIFLEEGGAWRLLDLPSAFEMTPSGARWLYKHSAGLLEVRSWAPVDRHELWLGARVLEGSPCRLLVSSHVAANGDDGSEARSARFVRDAGGVAVSLLRDTELGRRFPEGGFRMDPTPETALAQVGGDELLFQDGRSRGLPFVVLVTAPSTTVGLRITGQLVAAAPDGPARERREADAAEAERFWRRLGAPLDLAPPSGAPGRGLEPLREVLPWLVHDAWIHHLAPRGLEQFSGGGWGTRDVCQGPVDLWLALGRVEPVRDLLARVFSNQDPDGDWPQWFMFFEREAGIRPGDSHGDIVLWPLLALGRYLLRSGDAAFLEEKLPFFHSGGEAHAERATLLAHVERALARIERRRIPGTRLPAYGKGDWNDALQPADPALGERLCSGWTVTLQHQALATLAAALRDTDAAGLAARLEAELPLLREEFQRRLLCDGVVAGLACFGEDGAVRHWLHPSDRETGVRYSLLPMVHAILAGLFTPEQAGHHASLIRRHLLGADGARLFDRPLAYRGGVPRHFQRAETSAFFGREIGLMYVHAHLRYAEAMAELGDAAAFLRALGQVDPVGLRERVPSARRRQANCYTSSSDAEFPDRASAAARYDEVRTGAVAVEGGWRVYSSGAGLAVRLVREHLLGLRPGRSELGIDPVLPPDLDGLCARTELAGRPVEVRWRVGARGHGPRALVLNGAALPFTREENAYRQGGARVAMDALRPRLREAGNVLRIDLG